MVQQENDFHCGTRVLFSIVSWYCNTSRCLLFISNFAYDMILFNIIVSTYDIF